MLCWKLSQKGSYIMIPRLGDLQLSVFYKHLSESSIQHWLLCWWLYNWLCGRVDLVGLGRLPTYERESPIINQRLGETCQPWLTIHLGEGNSELKPMVRGICWHCPSLLGHGSWTLCSFLCRGAKFGLSGCSVPAFPSWLSSTFLRIVSGLWP